MVKAVLRKYFFNLKVGNDANIAINDLLISSV